jgi:CelD/BcsL family acetyltransferase involved in cellulose biosynthesis
MKIMVVKASELSPAHVDRWRVLQDANPELASPYFCPEFTQAVGAVREDAYVGVLEQDGQVVGFFPHQRRRFGFGGPAGGGFSDYQGVIAAPGTAWDAQELLRSCGLVAWEFTDVPVSQAPFAAFHAGRSESHYLDLTGGFDQYLQRLRAAGSSQPKKLPAFQRRAERECGPVEFVAHLDDKALFEQLIEWKSRQYRDSGLRDNFSYSWTVELLDRIRRTQTPSFAGMFSILKFHGKVAAMHLGMRSRTVWHWWFPRHDPEFDKFSPGILLLKMAGELAPSIGVTRIELGEGEEEFKMRLRSGAVSIARGRVEVPSVTMALVKMREASEAWVKSSPLAAVARGPGRLIKRLERWNRFR